MTEAANVNLTQADSLDVLILMDNYIDILLPPGARWIARPALAEHGKIPTDTLLAEHGLSLLITIRSGGQSTRVLLDAGYSQKGVPHNLDRLGVDLNGVEAVVLSHGHMDHFGSLPEVLRRIGGPVPLVVHPGAFRSGRFLDLPMAGRVDFPELSAEELAADGAEIVEAAEPYVAPNGLWAATGQVARTTDFEKGMPAAFLEAGGGREQDAIDDDMSIVVDLKGKGLAVISGCAHAGIVNTVKHAQELTGRDDVFAVVGGFHLTGPAFEPIIERTVDELKGIGPRVLMPMHCTGRKAMGRLETEFPEAFVLSSVGSLLSL